MVMLLIGNALFYKLTNIQSNLAKDHIAELSPLAGANGFVQS